MKIAVDARTLGSRPSGVGMYLNDFLKVLIEYKDLEFVLITDVAESEYIKYFIRRGIDVRVRGMATYKSPGVFAYFTFLQEQLDDIKPDIFWEVNTVIPKKLKGDFKIMITIHDMFPIDYVEYFGKVYSCYFKYGLKKTLKNTDMILYNSEQTKITTERIFPSAADIKNCTAYIISHPLKHKWDNHDNGYLLYVGNMEKRKGVDLLLKAYPRYRELGGNKPLVLAGKMQEPDIEAMLNDLLDSTDSVTYLDYVTNKKKHQLYSGCSCFVFPSKAEGFGMPVIEVMKFDKPILVSNLDIYEEVADGVVNEFDINCDEQEQIENLANAMISYDKKVDTQAYKRIIDRYKPDRLGKTVYDFIMENMEEI